MNKVYLGDFVYAEYDGHKFILTTACDNVEYNRVIINDNTLDNLLRFIQSIRIRNAQEKEINQSPS